MADAVESPYFIFPPELPVNGANMPLKSERSTEQKTGWKRRGWKKKSKRKKLSSVLSLSLSLVTLFRGRISEIDKPFNLNVADKFLFIL